MVACYNQLEKAEHLKGFQPRIHFLRMTRRVPQKIPPESLPRVRHRCWQEYIWPKGGYSPSFPALFFFIVLDGGFQMGLVLRDFGGRCGCRPIGIHFGGSWRCGRSDGGTWRCGRSDDVLHRLRRRSSTRRRLRRRHLYKIGE